MPLTNIQISDAGYISFDVEQTSGIDTVVSDDDNDSWYDLQGRKLTTKPTRKGLYIHQKQKIAIQ